MALIRIFVLVLLVLISNAPATDEKKTYLSLDAASILPVHTLSVKWHRTISQKLSWGAGINGFLVLGFSLNAEGFVTYTPINKQHYELPISLGLAMGWVQEGSFGPTPRNIFGLGPHLHITPITIKTEKVSISLLSLGVIFLSDYSFVTADDYGLASHSGIAASIYFFGLGLRYHL
jgi:hypothetical protein